ncbi:MAG: hypothetical protein IBX68_03630, partial [Dehalococcoidia bacterium]|nr:hypothetical protein [Dehalococcoidia bacterium]
PAGMSTTSIPDNGAVTEYRWHTVATEEQLQIIEQLWGDDITIGEFFQAVWPEVAEDLPVLILKSKISVEWPGESVDWDSGLSGGFVTAGFQAGRGPGISCSGKAEPDHPYGFHYYIGPPPSPWEKAMEVTPSPPPISYDSNREDYYICIYTGS